ncbi:maleylpyruvate isomerase family mycothiol-dependent enzyme [Arthrobacter sp. JZ12]|uniref:maleylpyruvate isomerase family mycothiol-dependent enzyme n=1 Tax=Arthrobacter sp. JZ12 TaxID=2654190 RepID=UPI002B47B8E3|nr:maleylpyruvate isomerase family mycothiol-dependent enzyme [Arthrobacter sp. JZ12]WRH24164.1 maleylpyruvate isomerase family mycothiol-dependent enzyme [Arthrobacter sp. JZ12]
MTDYAYALGLDQYRTYLDKDFGRMLELTRSAQNDGALSSRVPSCPGWDIEELVRHTALLYLQKAEVVRTGVKPTGRWIPEDVLALDPAAQLELGYSRLTGEFDSHQPSDPAESWMPDDQTVSFWIRRLTHETAIHRYDLETAVDDVHPIDRELAIDGIDEVLTVMFQRGRSARGSEPNPEGITGSVVLESGGQRWFVGLLPHDIEVATEAGDEPDAVVSGDPSEVLLWLWGRGALPADMVQQPAAAELRRRVAATT